MSEGKICADIVRVLEMPKFRGQFHFNGPSTELFLEHDFFNAETPDGLEDWIKRKPYYKPNKMYLVLAKNWAFTINYSSEFEGGHDR